MGSCFGKRGNVPPQELTEPLSGKERPSTLSPNHQPSQYRSPPIPLTRNQSAQTSPQCLNRSISIDSAVPTYQLKKVSDHPSYHGKMTGKAAVKILKDHGSTCYLTRYSQKKKSYIVSVLQVDTDESNETVSRQYKLNIYKHASNLKRVTVEIDGTEENFDCIDDLLCYYERNPVDHEVFGIGVMVEAKKRRRNRVAPRCKVNTFREEHIIQENLIEEILGSQPTPAELRDIRWTTSKGDTKHFNLIARISGTWAHAATLIGMNPDMIDNLDQRYNDNERRLESVMAHWIENCVDHKVFPATWAGLMELLITLERKTTADNLRMALEKKAVYN